MSERDLHMWEGKFRLWKILHPEYIQRHEMFKNFQDMCGKCIHAPTIEGIGVKVLHCPLGRLVTKDFKKLFPNDRIFGDEMAGLYCVEWIKYV